MFEVIKTIEFSACHKLGLDYPSKCNKMHGHNYVATIYCKSEELNDADMVVDFVHIKETIECLDHSNLNRLLGRRPTSENIAWWICHHVEKCWKVELSESRDNLVIYTKGDCH